MQAVMVFYPDAELDITDLQQPKQSMAADTAHFEMSLDCSTG